MPHSATESRIRWGFAVATVALLALIGLTYFRLHSLMQAAHTDPTLLATTSQDALTQALAHELRSTRVLFVGLTVAIAAAAALLAILLRRMFAELRAHRADEARLASANQVLESLLENIPAMVFAKDARDLRFVRFNRAGERLVGLPRDALLGKSDRDLFPPEQADAFIRKDREVLAQSDVIDVPVEAIDTRDMGRRLLHTRKVPVRDERGTPVFLLGISFDVTEEKAADARIRALSEETRQRAEMLEASNRELESFCYSVSHDLRAPLRAINGFAQRLQQEFGATLQGEATRYLTSIAAASEKMGRLIDDLLEFSRLGRQNIERELVDMAAIARKALTDATLARSPVPRVTMGRLPDAHGDRRLLHLAWLNLLDNAVKYSLGSGDPHIEIWAESRDGEAIYHIRDNGIGFDMAHADKLFGVFQRLHANPAYPGTGVGLAIAHRIITRHGGRIWGSSEPGQGATFSFTLPVETA